MRGRAAHRRARPGEARDRQLSRGREENCFAPNHPQQPELGRRELRLRANCGSSATTTPRPRPRATSGWRPVRRRACATGTSSGASAPNGTPPATSTVVHCTYDPETRSGTPGAERARSRATSTGCPPRTPFPAEYVSTTGCSTFRSPARRIRGACADVAAPRVPRRRTRGDRGRRRRRRGGRRARLPRRPQSGQQARDYGVRRAGARGGGAGGRACSSSGTAISSPTWPTTRRASRCSTAPSRSGTPGPSLPGGDLGAPAAPPRMPNFAPAHPR